MFEHYIFDFDNTLFDTSKGMEQCYIKALSVIGEKYQKNMLDKYVKESLKATYNRYMDSDDKFKDFENAFLETSKNCMSDETDIFPETKEVICKLYDYKKTISIVTGKPVERVREILNKFQMEKYFTDIIGYGDYTKDKPDPESLDLCIRKHSEIAKEECVYIGDSENDMKAAENAEIASILIDRSGHATNSVNNLKDILKSDNGSVCMFSVMTCNIDIWKTGDADSLIQKFCREKKYEKIGDYMYKVNIEPKKFLFISRFGILILAEIFPFKEIFPEDSQICSSEVLNWKENINNVYKYKENALPYKKMEDYVHCFSDNNLCRSLFENKVHYTLICYIHHTTKKSDWNLCDNEKLYLELLMKDSNKRIQSNKSIQDILKENGIEYYEIDENNLFATIWGARTFLTVGQENKYLNDYMIAEAKTQSLWLLLSSFNKEIDDKFNSGDAFELMDILYDVMLYQSEFKYLTAKTSHRYEIEIQKLLYKTSQLETIYAFFCNKAQLMERKIKMISEQQEKESDDNLNFILNVLTCVSAISAIFQIIDYWINSSRNHITFVLGSLLVIISICLIFIIRIFLVKRNKRKR